MKRGGSPLAIIALVAILLVTGFIVLVSFLITLRYQGGEMDKATGAGGEICANIPQPYYDILVGAGRKHAVQPAIIGAIFVGEHRSIKDSNYQNWPNPDGPWASSPKGASGPFQFMPGTWEGHKQDGNGDGVMDIMNLHDAAYGAADLLKGTVGNNSTDENKIRDAASKYNSGKVWGEGQKIAETKNYVENLVLPAFRTFYCQMELFTPSGAGNDNIPLYRQSDQRYKDMPYGSSTIGKSGCGPTSAAMVLKYYQKAVDPPTIARYSADKGFYVSGEGTKHDLFPSVAKHYSMNYKAFGTNWEEALKYLDKKMPLIARGAGSEPYTSGGHFIVITGYDKSNNTIRVNNPAKGDGPYNLTHMKNLTTHIYYIGND